MIEDSNQSKLQIISMGRGKALTLTGCMIHATLLSLAFIGKRITRATVQPRYRNKIDEIAAPESQRS
jgi:hypothetical protein